MWRDDAYVLDMLLAARKVLEFTEGIDWERFGRDELVQNAVMRQIQIIGEAARSVSPGYRAEHAQVPWAEIIGMRNRLVHEYFRILPRRVWDVVDKAEGDFSTMEREAVVVEDPNFEAVCFHAQQCAEKYLKARLCEADVRFGRVHDLVALLGVVLAIEPSWERFRQGLAYLSAFSVAVRYPGDSADPQCALEAQRHCQAFRMVARSSLGLDE